MYHCALRVVVPDEPGALGGVATRIGIAGGDVLGMDVLERTPGRVIDEFVVALERPADAEVLRREVASVGGVSIVEIRPVSADAHESGLAALEHAIGLLAMESADDFLPAALEDLVARTHSDGGALITSSGEILVEVGEPIDPRPTEGDRARCCVAIPAIDAKLAMHRRTADYRDRELRRVRVLAGLVDAKLRALVA